MPYGAVVLWCCLRLSSCLSTALVIFFTAMADAWILVSHLFDDTSSDLTIETCAVLRATMVPHAVELLMAICWQLVLPRLV